MTLHHYRDEHGLDSAAIANSAGEIEGPAEEAKKEEEEPTVTGHPHGH